MSLDIVVKRKSAFPYKHENVSEPLIGTSILAAISLGESILDEEGTGSQIIEYEVNYRAGLLCGQMVEIKDSLIKKVIRGKIISISHQCERGSDSGALTVFTRLKVKIPTDFYTVSL
jgi:acyl-CoA thioesterase FadM